MKTFLKMLLATILGGALLFFIGFILLLSVASMAEKEVEVSDNSILKLNLNQVIEERAQDNPFEDLAGLPFSPTPIGLNNILNALENAADDDNIKGVYLLGGIPATGHATIVEIRQALDRFKESGKFVYGYSEIMTQKGYLLASASDSLFVNPEGFFEWAGLSSQVTYLKKALDKLGVEPVVLRATNNKYKSAVEPYLREDMSAANREQLSELLNSIWGYYLENLSTTRQMEAEELNTLADSMALSSPKEAAKNGLIHRTAYEDEVMALMMNQTGVEERKDLKFISVNKYASTVKRGKGDYKSDRIAVIMAHGEIRSGEATEGVIGSERIAKAIRQARNSDKVKAVILRIDSPGGSALASEVIWREVKLTREVKPVVASFSDLAASGGYYIATEANEIVAQPTTITGSIGAFGLFFTAEELMNEKLGINIESVKTNKYADLGIIDQQISPSEKRMLVHQVDQIYNTFVTRVAEGRNLSVEQVRELGGGRVYSGSQALELGLVDQLGGMELALERAAELGEIEGDYRIVEYPELKDPITELLESLGGSYETKLLEKHLGEMAPYLNMLKNIEERSGLQARMEYDLVIE